MHSYRIAWRCICCCCCFCCDSIVTEPQRICVVTMHTHPQTVSYMVHFVHQNLRTKLNLRSISLSLVRSALLPVTRDKSERETRSEQGREENKSTECDRNTNRSEVDTTQRCTTMISTISQRAQQQSYSSVIIRCCRCRNRIRCCTNEMKLNEEKKNYTRRNTIRYHNIHLFI